MAKRQKGEITSTSDELSIHKVSRRDFEILANFYALCKKKNISEREISFLLGKYNKYFIEILNPFDKELIKTEFIDMLPAIASTNYLKIISNNLKPKEKIDVQGTFSYYDDDLIEIYKYYFTITYNDGSSKNFRWKIETTKGERTILNNRLLDILKAMAVSGYFDTSKFALTIYLDLKKKYKSKFSALEIQIALAKLCNKKADQDFALEAGTENMRVAYHKTLSPHAIMLSKLELNTERLLLRPFRKEDGAIMYALNDDNEVLQYTGDIQFADVSAAEEFFDKYDQYEKFSVGRMVVVLKETDEVLGWCGLKYDSESEEYDIGYRFFKKYWNNGYATESAKAVLEVGFERLAIKRVVGRARVENAASIRVFEKLEMKFVNNFVEDGENWVLYEVTANAPGEPISV